MLLADVEITPRQGQALRRWLDGLVAAQEREDHSRRFEAEIAQTEESYAERLTLLATLTAQMHGPIEGLCARFASEAAWQSFSCSESFFCPYDVDDHFEPNDEWREIWDNAYMNTIRKLKGKELPRITTTEAAALSHAP